MKRLLLSYVKEKYGTLPEYLFSDSPDIGVLRHTDNRKWYAVLMRTKKDKLIFGAEGYIEFVNLKSDMIFPFPELMGVGIFPAYHMNKTHWISVLLDGSVSENEIKYLIDKSYILTSSKKKLKKN